MAKTNKQGEPREGLLELRKGLLFLSNLCDSF